MEGPGTRASFTVRGFVLLLMELFAGTQEHSCSVFPPESLMGFYNFSWACSFSLREAGGAVSSFWEPPVPTCACSHFRQEWVFQPFLLDAWGPQGPWNPQDKTVIWGQILYASFKFHRGEATMVWYDYPLMNHGLRNTPEIQSSPRIG